MTKTRTAGHTLAFSGGVGGAKLALGLAKILTPETLTIVANTGDDFTHLGLSISPDLDTVMYTLADLNNKEQGWGLAGESWQFMDAMEKLGGETWFRLGDRDMATHIRRTQMLAAGMPLDQVTTTLCHSLGVEHLLVPMSNASVRTQVKSGSDWLDFQHYFVRLQCEPEVGEIRFRGIVDADPVPAFTAALEREDLAAIIICPSNPFVSVDPILSLPGMTKKLSAIPVPVIAVSPIIAGQAIKGPAAKMMASLGMPVTASGVAAHYRGIIDGFVVDSRDTSELAAIDAMDIPAIAVNTIMESLDDRVALAEQCLQFARQLSV